MNDELEIEPISKSQRKREHHAYQDLARRLIELSPKDFDRIELPERESFVGAPYDSMQEYLDDLEDVLEGHGKRLLFMLDEFDVLSGRVDSGDVEPEIFPFVRNLMQHRERIARLVIDEEVA